MEEELLFRKSNIIKHLCKKDIYKLEYSIKDLFLIYQRIIDGKIEELYYEILNEYIEKPREHKNNFIESNLEYIGIYITELENKIENLNNDLIKLEQILFSDIYHDNKNSIFEKIGNIRKRYIINLDTKKLGYTDIYKKFYEHINELKKNNRVRINALQYLHEMFLCIKSKNCDCENICTNILSIVFDNDETELTDIWRCANEMKHANFKFIEIGNGKYIYDQSDILWNCHSINEVDKKTVRFDHEDIMFKYKNHISGNEITINFNLSEICNKLYKFIRECDFIKQNLYMIINNYCIINKNVIKNTFSDNNDKLYNIYNNVLNKYQVKNVVNDILRFLKNITGIEFTNFSIIREHINEFILIYSDILCKKENCYATTSDIEKSYLNYKYKHENDLHTKILLLKFIKKIMDNDIFYAHFHICGDIKYIDIEENFIYYENHKISIKQIEIYYKILDKLSLCLSRIYSDINNIHGLVIYSIDENVLMEYEIKYLPGAYLYYDNDKKELGWKINSNKTYYTNILNNCKYTNNELITGSRKLSDVEAKKYYETNF